MTLTTTTINMLNMKLYVMHTDYHIMMTNYTHIYWTLFSQDQIKNILNSYR